MPKPAPFARLRRAAAVTACAVLAVASAPLSAQGEDCFNATPIGEGTVVGSNLGFVDDFGLADCFPASDLWFAFVPSTSGTATFDLNPLYYPAMIAVADASGGCNAPPSLDCEFATTFPGSVTATAVVTAGQAYFVVIGAAGFGIDGSWALTVTVAPGPANDECAGAAPIGEGFTTDSTVGATPTAGVPPHPVVPGAADVWFLYTPTCTGFATASTALELGGSSPGASTVRIWSAGPCPPAGQLSALDEGSIVGAGWTAGDYVTAGTPVLVQVQTAAGAPGQFTLAIACRPAPFNDVCASATPLQTGTNGPFDNAAGAGGGALGMASCSLFAERNVWFRWTAPETGWIEVATAGGYALVAAYAACGGAELDCGFPIRFYAQAGAEYRFKVTGASTTVVVFTLDVRYPYQMVVETPTPFVRPIGQRHGPPGGLFFTAVTAFEGAFPLGAFFGVDVSSGELAAQLTWPGGLPFVGALDAAGAATNIALPAGPPLGFQLYMVSLALDPATGFAFYGATEPFTVLL